MHTYHATHWTGKVKQPVLATLFFLQKIIAIITYN